MVSADNLVIAGAHLPFPGFGRIVKDSAAFRYVPADFADVI